jgi:hypothetical protein
MPFLMPRRTRYHLIPWWHRTRERLAQHLADHLPRRVIYWAAIRVLVYATTGRYGTTTPASLTAVEALQRWRKSDRD